MNFAKNSILKFDLIYEMDFAPKKARKIKGGFLLKKEKNHFRYFFINILAN